MIEIRGCSKAFGTLMAVSKVSLEIIMFQYKCLHFPGKPFLWRRWKTPQCGNGIHHGYQHPERTVRVLPENM